MLTSVFLKSLRDLRRSLLGWGIGLTVLIGGMAALWPSLRDIPDLEEFLSNYPEAMRELFNIEAITTGAGFMNAELFSILLPILFIIFAIGRGARMVAGEEEDGTLEALLVTPVSRIRLLVEKAAALAVAIVALGVVLFVAMAASDVLADMHIGVNEVAAGSTAMVLLGIEHGWLALAVGAVDGRRSRAIAVASTVAVAGYVLYIMAAFVGSVEPWRPLSPFHQALAGGPLGGGWPAAFLWMPTAAVAFVAAAAPLFARRDIRVR